MPRSSSPSSSAAEPQVRGHLAAPAQIAQLFVQRQGRGGLPAGLEGLPVRRRQQRPAAIDARPGGGIEGGPASHQFVQQGVRGGPAGC